MSIISLKFIVFIAALTVVYFVLPKKWQWVILLLASAAFYLTVGWKGIFFILVTIVTQYYLGLALERKNGEMAKAMTGKNIGGKEKKQIRKQFSKKKKGYLLLSLFINLGILCAVKYTNPIISTLNGIFGTQNGPVDILVPFGLSYYTFKSIGYVIDVYRGRIKAQRNIAKLALYIGYFPALVQGPIDRYEDLAEQLYAEHSFDYKRVSFGAQRMLWGYIKKLVIAERAAVLVNEAVGNYAEKGYVGFVLFVGIALYAVQIYADFSGGMDIVIGLSEIFGISLTENFRRPFFATSVAEYWQRWHITLGAWMRTYVFYPISLSPAFNKLGRKCRATFGDRTGKLIAPSIASFITFVLIGIWHGVGWKYVLYGLYMAIFVSLGTLLENVYEKGRTLCHVEASSAGWRIFQSFRTFLIITMSRYVNLAKDLPDMIGMFKATFSSFNPWVFFDGTFYNLGQVTQGFNETFCIQGLNRPNVILLLISILVLLGVDLMLEKGIHIRESIAKQGIVFRWVIYFAAIFTLIIFGMYGPAFDVRDFIYNGF